MTLGRALSRSWEIFRANPLGEAMAALFFLLGTATGLLTGFSAVFYTAWLRASAQPVPAPIRLMMIPAQLQGRFRMATAFWLGLTLFILYLLPSLMHPLLGFPAWYVIGQPLWLALILTALYDLPLGVTLRTIAALAIDAPGTALTLFALGLLAFVGIAAFGVGLFVTVPLAFRAALLYLGDTRPEVTAAMQKAYR